MEKETPWDLAVKLFFFGLLFYALTFDIYNMYIFNPFIGATCFVFSLHIIKHLNYHFRKSYISSFVNLILTFIVFSLSLTPQQYWLEGHLVLVTSILVLPFSYMFIQIHLGIRHIQKENKLPKGYTGIYALLVVYLFIFGIRSFNGSQLLHLYYLLFIFLVLTIMFSLMHDYVKDINKASLQFPTYPFFQKKWTKYLVGHILIVSIISLSFMFFVNYNHGERAETFLVTEEIPIIKQLMDAGIPKDFLLTVTKEELLRLEGFEEIEFIKEPISYQKHKTWKQEFSAAYIKMPNNIYYVIFLIEALDKPIPFRSAFSITSVNNAAESEIISARMLYNESNQTLTKDILELSQNFISSDYMRGGTDTIYGTISYPFGSTEQKAVVMEKLTYREGVEGNTGVILLKINKPSTFLAIPYEKPEALSKKNFHGTGGAGFNMYIE